MAEYVLKHGVEFEASLLCGRMRVRVTDLIDAQTRNVDARWIWLYDAEDNARDKIEICLLDQPAEAKVDINQLLRDEVWQRSLYDQITNFWRLIPLRAEASRVVAVGRRKHHTLKLPEGASLGTLKHWELCHLIDSQI